MRSSENKEISHEDRLVALFKDLLKSSDSSVVTSIGDDAAVIKASGYQIVTVDSLVEGVHFAREADLSAVGHKALACALSDLAAMGVAAGQSYIAIGWPSERTEEQLLALYGGIAELAESSGCTVCGGDLTRSKEVFISVTAIAAASSSQPIVTRSGASAGELVAVSGQLGGAAAGLAVLEGGPISLKPAIAAALIERQQRPEPQLALGQALADAGVSAMIDLSDGLGTDLRRLAAASQVRAVIELAKLPLQEGVSEVATSLGSSGLEFAASGGEDYELLFTVTPEKLKAVETAAQRLNKRVTVIGAIEEDSGETVFKGVDGSELELYGFDHFRLS